MECRVYGSIEITVRVRVTVRVSFRVKVSLSWG